MKEHLERMIQYVKETHLVESLMNASSLEERVKICEDARTTAEFEAFKACYNEAVEELENPDVDALLSCTDFECTKDNAVAVAMILIIAEVDDPDMFEDFEELPGALQRVKGEQSKMAKAIANFLEWHVISENPLVKILEEIF